MIKFIHRKHMAKHSDNAKVVIYYSVGEIFLGVLLVLLACFFAYNYIKDNMSNSTRSDYGPVTNQTVPLR